MTGARRTRRGGFTLVELLVAAAMMIMGMWLLSWVYQQGLESFRQARAQADLTGQQRMVTSLLTRDLQAAHFEDDDSKPNHGRRLSDQTKGWLTGSYTPPRGGYFRARSTQVDAFESIQDGFASSRSVSHYLQFTAILPGGPSQDLFSAAVPANSTNQYYATAAEVTYFLYPNGMTTRSGGAGVPLYDLYRRQRIVAHTTDDAKAYAAAAAQPDAPEVMVVLNQQMQTLPALTVPIMGGVQSVRLPGPDSFAPLGITSNRYGTDKLMSNVLSFEVKFTGVAADGSIPGGWPRPFASGNTDFPYDTLPYDGRIDTFSAQVPNWSAPTNIAQGSNPATWGAPMKPLRITGVMIRLRTYDTRTYSSRQTTLTLDL
jgi:type II secretory pathway pseudopilin PulG